MLEFIAETPKNPVIADDRLKKLLANNPADGFLIANEIYTKTNRALLNFISKDINFENAYRLLSDPATFWRLSEYQGLSQYWKPISRNTRFLPVLNKAIEYMSTKGIDPNDFIVDLLSSNETEESKKPTAEKVLALIKYLDDPKIKLNRTAVKFRNNLRNRMTAARYSINAVDNLYEDDGYWDQVRAKAHQDKLVQLKDFLNVILNDSTVNEIHLNSILLHTTQILTAQERNEIFSDLNITNFEKLFRHVAKEESQETLLMEIIAMEHCSINNIARYILANSKNFNNVLEKITNVNKKSMLIQALICHSETKLPLLNSIFNFLDESPVSADLFQRLSTDDLLSLYNKVKTSNERTLTKLFYKLTPKEKWLELLKTELSPEVRNNIISDLITQQRKTLSVLTLENPTVFTSADAELIINSSDFDYLTPSEITGLTQIIPKDTDNANLNAFKSKLARELEKTAYLNKFSKEELAIIFKSLSTAQIAKIIEISTKNSQEQNLIFSQMNIASAKSDEELNYIGELRFYQNLPFIIYAMREGKNANVDVVLTKITQDSNAELKMSDLINLLKEDDNAFESLPESFKEHHLFQAWLTTGSLDYIIGVKSTFDYVKTRPSEAEVNSLKKAAQNQQPLSQKAEKNAQMLLELGLAEIISREFNDENKAVVDSILSTKTLPDIPMNGNNNFYLEFLTNNQGNLNSIYGLRNAIDHTLERIDENKQNTLIAFVEFLEEQFKIEEEVDPTFLTKMSEHAKKHNLVHLSGILDLYIAYHVVDKKNDLLKIILENLVPYTNQAFMTEQVIDEYRGLSDKLELECDRTIACTLAAYQYDPSQKDDENLARLNAFVEQLDLRFDKPNADTLFNKLPASALIQIIASYHQLIAKPSCNEALKESYTMLLRIIYSHSYLNDNPILNLVDTLGSISDEIRDSIYLFVINDSERFKLENGSNDVLTFFTDAVVDYILSDNKAKAYFISKYGALVSASNEKLFEKFVIEVEEVQSKKLDETSQVETLTARAIRLIKLLTTPSYLSGKGLTGETISKMTNDYVRLSLLIRKNNLEQNKAQILALKNELKTEKNGIKRQKILADIAILTQEVNRLESSHVTDSLREVFRQFQDNINEVKASAENELDEDLAEYIANAFKDFIEKELAKGDSNSFQRFIHRIIIGENTADLMIENSLIKRLVNKYFPGENIVTKELRKFGKLEISPGDKVYTKSQGVLTEAGEIIFDSDTIRVQKKPEVIVLDSGIELTSLSVTESIEPYTVLYNDRGELLGIVTENNILEVENVFNARLSTAMVIGKANNLPPAALNNMLSFLLAKENGLSDFLNQNLPEKAVNAILELLKKPQERAFVLSAEDIKALIGKFPMDRVMDVFKAYIENKTIPRTTVIAQSILTSDDHGAARETAFAMLQKLCDSASFLSYLEDQTHRSAFFNTLQAFELTHAEQNELIQLCKNPNQATLKLLLQMDGIIKNNESVKIPEIDISGLPADILKQVFKDSADRAAQIAKDLLNNPNNFRCMTTELFDILITQVDFKEYCKEFIKDLSCRYAENKLERFCEYKPEEFFSALSAIPEADREKFLRTIFANQRFAETMAEQVQYFPVTLYNAESLKSIISNIMDNSTEFTPDMAKMFSKVCTKEIMTEIIKNTRDTESQRKILQFVQLPAFAKFTPSPFENFILSAATNGATAIFYTMENKFSLSTANHKINDSTAISVFLNNFKPSDSPNEKLTQLVRDYLGVSPGLNKVAHISDYLKSTNSAVQDAIISNLISTPTIIQQWNDTTTDNLVSYCRKTPGNYKEKIFAPLAAQKRYQDIVEIADKLIRKASDDTLKIPLQQAKADAEFETKIATEKPGKFMEAFRRHKHYSGNNWFVAGFKALKFAASSNDSSSLPKSQLIAAGGQESVTSTTSAVSSIDISSTTTSAGNLVDIFPRLNTIMTTISNKISVPEINKLPEKISLLLNDGIGDKDFVPTPLELIRLRQEIDDLFFQIGQLSIGNSVTIAGKTVTFTDDQRAAAKQCLESAKGLIEENRDALIKAYKETPNRDHFARKLDEVLQNASTYPSISVKAEPITEPQEPIPVSPHIPQQQARY